MSDQEHPQRHAARTTIVGGQPPGNARALPAIPIGLERLLGLAAAHEDFARLLLTRRDETREASGLALTASERAILAATPTVQLERMIAEVRARLAQADRRAFFEQAAAVVVLVAGGAGVLSAAGCKDKDAPAEHQNVSVKERPRNPDLDAPETGARPDHPDYPPPTGARPDRPEPPRPDAGAPPPKPRGIQPDRPPRRDDTRVTGIRPDRGE
jgi:hypothetical protein